MKKPAKAEGKKNAGSASAVRNALAKADGKSGYQQQYKSVAFSCLVGVGVTVVFLAIFALIMSFKDLPHGAITPVAIAAVVIGCFSAGYCCGNLLKTGGLLFGFICGTILFLLAFLCELILIGGGVSILLFYKYIIYIASGMIGGVLGVNKRRKLKASPGRKK